MPTIRDVARACGVSPATVSQVLSSNRPVSPRTRERILQTMREMKFYPSAVARGLSYRRMNSLGIVFPEPHASPIKDPYFSSVLDGIVCRARDFRQNATLFLGHYELPTEERVSMFCDGRSDGLIMISPGIDDTLLLAMLERNVPFVVVGAATSLPGATTIDIDHVAGARLLTEHLLANGHRRIGIVVGSTTARCSGQRLDGYRQALEAHGIAPDARLIVQGSFADPTDACIRTLMQYDADVRPTAIFCSNDRIALDAMQTLRELGFSVPEDVSIVGFDDIPAAATSAPALTTIRQPMREIGVLATERVLDLIEKREEAGSRITLEAELMVRGSVAPWR